MKEPFACIKRKGMGHTATINVTMRNIPTIPCNHTLVVQPTAWSQIPVVQSGVAENHKNWGYCLILPFLWLAAV